MVRKLTKGELASADLAEQVRAGKITQSEGQRILTEIRKLVAGLLNSTHADHNGPLIRAADPAPECDEVVIGKKLYWSLIRGFA